MRKVFSKKEMALTGDVDEEFAKKLVDWDLTLSEKHTTKVVSMMSLQQEDLFTSSMHSECLVTE